jgi:HlyD family secretion protein
VLLADLQKQLDRTQQLFDRGMANQRQLDQAVLAIKTREAQIESARTQLVQSEANLAAAQLNLSYTKIYSPIDGVVIQSRVMVGQTVQASMTTPTLFQLATAVETLKLSAGVDEADIGRVRPGQLVEFQVGTYGQELFKGTVEAIRLNASTSNNVVTYPVWINVPNPDLRLRPSMTAQVFIRVSQTGEVVRIPNKALMFRPTRAVYTALGAPMVEQNPVRALDLQADRIADPNAKSDILVDPNADSIDELFAPLPKADARATVWTWDETNRRLNPVPVRVGVTDGETTELLAGNLEAGDELVTGVLVPETNAPRPGQNPLVGNQRRIR